MGKLESYQELRLHSLALKANLSLLLSVSLLYSSVFVDWILLLVLVAYDSPWPPP